jgi:hypothetical protein
MSVRLSDCLEKLGYHFTASYFCTVCNAALGTLHSAVYSALSHTGGLIWNEQERIRKEAFVDQLENDKKI